MKLNTRKFDVLQNLLKERILVLDGAMGSLIQCHCAVHGGESDHDGHGHNGHSGEGGAIEGIADFLVETDPELIKSVHRDYLEAGADIIETDSFNCNRFSLSDYGREADSYALSKRAAELAREAADEFTARNPEKPRFVAGSVGPTKHMLSLAEPGGELTFDSMAAAYEEQIDGLLDGGADIILLETIFDTLTVKAALYAVSRTEERRGEKIPVMVSATVANSSGRLLAGQTIEAFYASVSHAGLLSVGLNCGFGSADMLPFARRLSEVAETSVSLYPNAGLPDDCGEYHEDPATFTGNLEECLREGLVNIVGGCCGTTPGHIRRLAEVVAKYPPRRIPDATHTLVLSNMERSDIGSSREVVHVGERTNVAGSAKFARLVREKNFEEALDIAARQVRAGARIIDVCMDDGLDDSAGNMVAFIRMLNADSETGTVPVMIDSSDWNVITSALKVSQGKSIVNSISLKEGEEEFLSHAREIRRLGAAAVVMLFDERGQAETYERKIEIARRAYDLLTADGFAPEDIIFDPNVLTVGSGLKEKDTLALDFIRATKWLKENLPYASVSGGISNLSFAFRGNNPLREAMHTVFIYHASKAGLDMAIVNAGMLGLYSDIEDRLLGLIEDLLLARTEDAVGAMIGYAEKMKADAGGAPEESVSEEEPTLESRIGKALAKGKESEIELLMEEALKSRSPMAIIEEVLMPEMKRIGQLFGEGKMFLPQVIKSAQVMKKAVAVLQPYMDAEASSGSDARVVIATVKGDVHDIGKNIVSLVVSCNGFEVNDLGVRVDETTIVDHAQATGAYAVLLSGLISPSLGEMVKVCAELERRGMTVPVIIGGAATSEMHTAVRIAPTYSGPVFYSPDAGTNLNILNSLSAESVEANRRRQEELRRKFYKSKTELPTSEEVAKELKDDKPDEPKPEAVRGANDGTSCQPCADEPKVGLERIVWRDFPVETLEAFIDWDWLLHSLEMSKEGARGQSELREEILREAKEIFERIKRECLLHPEGVVQLFKARRYENNIVVCAPGGERVFPMSPSGYGPDRSLSVADLVSPAGDYIALFAVSAGKGLEELVGEYNARGDYYSGIIAKLIADRLAEAFAQWVDAYLARELWGYSDGESLRVAFGYPAAPRHELKCDAFELLDVEGATDMRLTETAMIVPSEAVCGIIVRNRSGVRFW